MGGGKAQPEPPANWSSDATLNFSSNGAALPAGAGKGCYYAPNLVLGISVDVNHALTCDPGFYCPYLNVSDETTLPVVCPPSPMCVKYRMFGFPCSAQGLYEPIICKPGFYCSDSHTMLPCPQGYYCPTGTVTPHKCTILASCPKGSTYQVVYLFLVLVAGVDILLALLLWFLRERHRQKSANGTNTKRPGTIAHSFHTHMTKWSLWWELLGRKLFGMASRTRLRMLSQAMMRASPPHGAHFRDSVSTLLVDEDIPIPSEEISKDTLRHDLTMLSNAFKETFPLHGHVRMNFRFEGLELALKDGTKVLKGVTGRIREGKMTAILGPSGAGKTTFMNVLMGKVDKTGGKLLINGQESEVHLYRKIIGYVPQEDIMLKELTVRENVLHSARVRLPRSWSNKKIQSHVDNVLKTLKLSNVAHSIIGDETVRGISGGQRKRVNIGMELAAAPLTIFLDEPTSGLDSTSALDVADILSSMSSLGITIVAVVHQPRIEIFQKFHDVIMVAPGGQVAFMGPVTRVRSYFESLGFYFEEYANVSDVAMDILAGKGVNSVCGGSLGVKQVVELWENRELRKAFVQGVKAQRRILAEYGSSVGVSSQSGSRTSRASESRRAPVTPAKAATSHFGHGVFGNAAYLSRLPDATVPQLTKVEMDDDHWRGDFGVESVGSSVNGADTFGLLSHGLVGRKKYDVMRVRKLGSPSNSNGRLQPFSPLNTPINTFFNSVTGGSTTSSSICSTPLRKKVSNSGSVSGGESGFGMKRRSPFAHTSEIPLESLIRKGQRIVEGTVSDDEKQAHHPRSSVSTATSAPHFFQDIKNRYLSAAHSLPRSFQFDSDSGGCSSDLNLILRDSERFVDPESVKSQKRRQAWKRNREFHNIVPTVVESRGAGFWKQVYYCHQRSLLQQSRLVNAFILEIIVAVVAGLLMGISAQGRLKELYAGAYYGDYAGISPKPLDVISLYCFLLGLAVALASAPAAVKVFGEEKTVYWREAASGHNRFAYFLGKTVATVYRLFIMSLHFTAIYMILAKPVIDPYIQYFIVLLQYWGVYGMSCIISMVVRRENASLLAVVMCLFASVLCGYGPSIWQAKQWGVNWVMELSFNKWAAEAMYASSVLPYQNRYNIQLTADMFGWSLDQLYLDFFMCIFLGLMMRVLAFVLLLVLNRDKQR